jgi:hypothetical protein
MQTREKRRAQIDDAAAHDCHIFLIDRLRAANRAQVDEIGHAVDDDAVAGPERSEWGAGVPVPGTTISSAGRALSGA